MLQQRGHHTNDAMVSPVEASSHTDQGSSKLQEKHSVKMNVLSLKLLTDTARGTILFASLLWQKHTVNVGKNTTSSNGHIPQKLQANTKAQSQQLCHATLKQGTTMMTNTLLSSSSLRTASWMCRGTILVFLLSLAALPASSRTSAARYSSTAACRSSVVTSAVGEVLNARKLDMQPSDRFLTTR